jgi:hypothetical protein
MPFIGQQPTSGLFIELDSLTASATANYDLQLNGAYYYPESVNNLLVSINGVIQGSNTLSLSGYTLTVGATLSSSDTIDFVRVFGNVGTISTPTDGSVTANKIASGAVTDVKIGTMSSSKLTGALPSSVTSSGVYIGGTGSANYLDDYEEGTWTPVYGGSTSAGTVSLGSTEGLYTKTGNFVTIWLRLSNITLSNATGIFKISGLPFTSSHGSNAYASTAIAMTNAINFDTARNQSLYLIGTDLYGLESVNGAAWVDWGVTNGSGIYMNYTVTYRTA